MNKVRLIPEYKEVSKLYLSFENDFFNTRFKYGKAIADIVKAIDGKVPIEIFVNHGDESFLYRELDSIDLFSNNVTLISKYSGTSITSSGMPIFAESNENNKLFGITYNYLRDHEQYNHSYKKIEEFSKWLIVKENIGEINLNFDFNSAAISVMDEIVLISDNILNKNREDEIKLFLYNLIEQDIHFVSSLPGDFTNDLDTYLFPVKNKVWVISEYPDNTLQRKTIDKTVSLLKGLGHTIHFVPGLDNIKHDDIDTMPNYTNSIILNDLILVPEYAREEDAVIKNILKIYGFEIKGIDSRKIVESNSVLHCISKTLPKV